MRIHFLYLYIIFHSIVHAEVSTSYFHLKHYSLKNHSAGLGLSKENIGSQKLLGWIHSGKDISPDFGINLHLQFLGYKQNVQVIHPVTDEATNIYLKSGRIMTISPGFSYKFISLYSNIHSVHPTFKDFSLGIDLYFEKSIFLFYKENTKENTKTYALSVISGRIPAIGLSVAKDYYAGTSEWSGSIGLSFQFDSFQVGATYFAENQKEENSFFLSKIFSEKTNPLFKKEINPYNDENDTAREKKEKDWEAKKSIKKERIIYEIKIEELLKFRIPLVVAIRIARASKSKEEYTELLKILPRDIVKKCNKIQYDKSKAQP